MANSWQHVIDRLARFEAMPRQRPSETARSPRRPRYDAELRRLERQLEQWRPFLPPEPPVEQHHVDAALKAYGIAMRSPTSRAAAQGFWMGLWRAIVLDRCNYTCFACGRSGEQPAAASAEPEAIELLLDHAVSRFKGGNDYELGNMQAICRKCRESRKAELNAKASATRARR